MDEQLTIYLQEMLMNLSSKNLEIALDFIISSIFIESQHNLQLLVHNFFIAASCRPKNMMILSHLLFSLYDHNINKTTALKFLPRVIQDESKYNLNPPFYFYYCLMKAGFSSDLIINCLVDQFEHSLHKRLISQNKKIFTDDQIFYGYALFAPELIESNKFEWFEYVMEYYKDKQYKKANQESEEDENKNNEPSNSTFSMGFDFTLTKKVESFIKLFPSLSENNFEKYFHFRDFGWNPDEIYGAIQKDDDKKLDSILKGSEKGSIIDLINRPIKWSVFERCQFLQNDPFPIHVAAFFNSTKCLSYLIQRGANLSATDLCGRTVIQFAVAGGCEDMRLFDRNKFSFDGALHIAARFHRYQIFETIMSLHQVGKLIIQPKRPSYNSQNSTGSHSTTADTSDIEGDSTVLTNSQNKQKIKKTEIKTRSEYKPKIQIKPKITAKSKNSFILGITACMSINGLQAYFANNIKGLGSILHQASLSNCVKILALFLPKPQHRDIHINLNGEFDLSGFVNDQASNERVFNSYPCYSSYITNDTPLIVAIKSYNIEAVNFLLSNPSVDINARESTMSKSPLHIAAKRGYGQIIKSLLSNEVIDFNPKDVLGRTPIFEAAFYLRYDILEIFADYNDVDFKVKDNSGQKVSEIDLISPTDSDSEIHFSEIIRLLRKYTK